MNEIQGFFIKINKRYVGPFETLNLARSEARIYGSDVPIYHGILEYSNDDEIQIDTNLFLIPKVTKKGNNM